jgi:hypothetical protein
VIFSNLYDFFKYKNVCPLCKSEGRHFIFQNSKAPFINFKYSISKKYLTLLLDDFKYIKIDIKSNHISFGPETFGDLSGGDFYFLIACDCNMFKFDGAALYKNEKLSDVSLLSEHIKIVSGSKKYDLYRNYFYDDAVLSYGIDGSESSQIKIQMFELASYEKEYLINKFDKIILLK